MMDEGTGPPVIVIPGIQGRWEWMRPALRALVPTCRTISYSLAGDAGAEVPAAADPRLRQLRPTTGSRSSSAPA